VADSIDILTDDSRLTAHIDTVTSGAFSSFVTGARRTLAPIMADAAAEAPVDLVNGGTFARSFRMVEQLREDAVDVSIVNTAPYARWVRFSRRLEDSIKREAAARGREERPNSPRAAQAVERRLLDPTVPGSLTWWHGEGAPSDALSGRSAIVSLVRSPGRRASRVFIDDQREALAALAQGSV